MWGLFTYKPIIYNMRNQKQLLVSHSRTKRHGQESFSVNGAKLWNSLPNNIKDCDNLGCFKNLVMKWFPVDSL